MTDIDENLYSRQIYAIGASAMKKLSNSSVLISGMGGVGIEIAKNIIIAGVKNVTIHDTRLATIEDLGSNFYLSENSVNSNRALACYEKLIALNKYTTLSVITDPLTTDIISKYPCFVLTDWQKEEDILNYSSFCHSNGIKFIFSDVRGLYGMIFTDNCKDFTTTKLNDAQPKQFSIVNISNDKRGIVQASEPLYGFESDGYVKFRGIEGMTELNNKTCKYKMASNSNMHIAIEDTTKYGKFENKHNTAVGIEVKTGKKLTYKSWKTVMSSPKGCFLEFDFAHPDSHALTLLSFLAYQKCITDSPKVSFEQLLEAATQINESTKLVDVVNESIIKNFAATCESVISPMASIIGGIAGQEIMKSLTGIFTPIKQIFAFHSLDSIPDINNIVFEPKGDRYDSYRRVFGNQTIENFKKLKYFIIGAGALGCELLKNWSLMGLACSPDGKVILTDMDEIEVSNLSRQFLFHENNVKQMKSTVAAEACRVFNPAFNIEAQTNRLDDISEQDIYTEDFYSKLDGVCNALDNIQARKKSDHLCVKYGKSLLESGTQGTQFHFQVYIPRLKTQSYSSQTDTETGSVPMCTIHSFPSKIDHTIVWALNQFTDMFEDQPTMINMFIDNKDYIKNTAETEPGNLIIAVKNIEKLMIKKKPSDFKGCSKLARDLYENYFVTIINRVLTEHPEGSVDVDGKPFWLNEGRKMPVPLPYDRNDSLTQGFIRSAARLIADMYGIKVEGDAVELCEGGEVDGTDFESTVTKDVSQIPNDLFSEVRSMHKLKSVQFEKDNDSNGHVAFIHYAANLRAKAYGIITVDERESKRIAGNIIPALSTTTAAVCGFVCLEMYKLHSTVPKSLDAFKWGYVNLSDNNYTMYEPVPDIKHVVSTTGEEFTSWDKWYFEDMSVKDFIKAVEDRAKGSLQMLSVNDKLIYSVITANDEKQLEMKISEVLANTGVVVKPGNHYTKVGVYINDGERHTIGTPDILVRIN